MTAIEVINSADDTDHYVIVANDDKVPTLLASLTEANTEGLFTIRATEVTDVADVLTYVRDENATLAADLEAGR